MFIIILLNFFLLPVLWVLAVVVADFFRTTPPVSVANEKAFSIHRDIENATAKYQFEYLNDRITDFQIKYESKNVERHVIYLRNHLIRKFKTIPELAALPI